MIGIDQALSIIGAYLNLVSEKEKNKYIERYLDLKSDLYDEVSKPIEQQDHGLIDDIQRDIKDLLESVFKLRGN